MSDTVSIRITADTSGVEAGIQQVRGDLGELKSTVPGRRGQHERRLCRDARRGRTQRSVDGCADRQHARIEAARKSSAA